MSHPQSPQPRVPNFAYDRFTFPDHVDLTGYFTPHSIGVDLPKNMPKIFKQSDVAIIEVCGADKEPHAAGLEALARAQPGVKEFSEKVAKSSANPGWQLAVHNALYRSDVKIVIPDHPLGHPHIDRRHRVEDQVNAAVHQRNFIDAVGATTQLLPLYFRLHQQRDQYIAEHTAGGIANVIQATPEFLEKIESGKRIQATMLYGGSHGPAFDAIAYQIDSHIPKIESSAIKNTQDDAKNIEDDLYHKFLTGQEIDEIDVARFTIERLNYLLNERHPDPREASRPTRIRMNRIYQEFGALSLAETCEKHAELLGRR